MASRLVVTFFPWIYTFELSMNKYTESAVPFRTTKGRIGTFDIINKYDRKNLLSKN